MSQDETRSVYIVDGTRTPIRKFRGKPGGLTATNLAVSAGNALLIRQTFDMNAIDEVILGCVMPLPKEANIARVAALRLGLPVHIPAWTVQRNCASGMQALDSAAARITLGASNIVLAGGVEAMSHAPLLFDSMAVAWLGEWRNARSVRQKIRALTKLRLRYFKPVVSLLRGLTDPTVNLSMGQTAENIVHRFGITREAMDLFAYESHSRLARAQDEDVFSEEISPIYDDQGNVFIHDDGLRRDTDAEKLSALPAVFDRRFGNVTAGNSAQISDGAAWLILASHEAVRKHRLPVLGKLCATRWAGLDPAQMGLGPAFAVAALLCERKLSLQEIDYWEINEAFAGQVLACLAAWEDERFCCEQLRLTCALGRLNRTRLNVDGGAIACGHPVGMSGARIVLHLLHVLRRNQVRQGIATMCIGGGQGGAMLIEQPND